VFYHQDVIMGFAIVTYTPPENAIKAYAELDGAVFQVGVDLAP
jgi:RNA recognition motif-containing protein